MDIVHRSDTAIDFLVGELLMEQKSEQVLAPELQVSRWFNTKEPLTLAALRGRPILLHTFQMLCPGCVVHAIPQAQKIHGMLRNTDLAVVGLHTVFEHHEAMTPVSLEAFIHEYRITFPVGVDMASESGPIPKTMAAYGLRGTPSTVLIDRQGFIRHHGFGQEEDVALGFRLGLLLAERPAELATQADKREAAGCDDDGCSISA
jgi:peroxiredoxin